MTSIVKCFLDVNMSLAHDGLAAIARKAKIDVRTLGPDQFVAFINTRKNRVKLYAPGNVFAYLKLEGNRTVTVDVIRKIPRAFTASAPDIVVPKAIELRLAKELGASRETLSSDSYDLARAV